MFNAANAHAYVLLEDDTLFTLALGGNLKCGKRDQKVNLVDSNLD